MPTKRRRLSKFSAYLTRESEAVFAEADRDIESDPVRHWGRCKAWCLWRARESGFAVPDGARFTVEHRPGSLIGRFTKPGAARWDTPDVNGNVRLRSAPDDVLAEVVIPLHCQPVRGKIENPVPDFSPDEQGTTP